jgi:hypothetical protein
MDVCLVLQTALRNKEFYRIENFLPLRSIYIVHFSLQIISFKIVSDISSVIKHFPSTYYRIFENFTYYIWLLSLHTRKWKVLMLVSV